MNISVRTTEEGALFAESSIKLIELTKGHGSVASFHTLGSRGRNLQATRCVLGGKSRVNAVTLS